MKSHAIRTAPFAFLALVVGTVVTLTWSTPGWADSRGHGHGKRPDATHFMRHVLKAKEALGLSDEQNTRLRTITVAFMKARVMKKAEVDLAKIDLRQLFHQEQASLADFEAAVKKVYTLKADLRLASIKTVREARAVLTTDQLKKLKDLRGHNKRGSRDGKRSGHGRHDGSGKIR